MTLRIKELIVVALIAAFILVVSRQNHYIDTSVDNILTQVSSTLELDGMEQFDASAVKKDFGINVNDYDGVIYYGHETVMNSETLLIIKLKDNEQGNSIIKYIDGQRKTNEELFKSYAADQYELLKNSVLEQKGQYLIYVVAADAKAVEKAFTESITG